VRSRLLSNSCDPCPFSYVRPFAAEAEEDGSAARNSAVVKAALQLCPRGTSEARADHPEPVRVPDYVLAPWVKSQVPEGDPLRDGFRAQGFRLARLLDRFTTRGAITFFYIDVRHGKSSRRPDNITFIGHRIHARFSSITRSTSR